MSRAEVACYLAGFVGVVVAVARERLRYRPPSPPAGRPRVKREHDGLDYIRFH
jgi:hypothetical protein